VPTAKVPLKSLDSVAVKLIVLVLNVGDTAIVYNPVAGRFVNATCVAPTHGPLANEAPLGEVTEYFMQSELGVTTILLSAKLKL